jgi:gamma-glutamyltranspeptidase/glutathione hydrolase
LKSYKAKFREPHVFDYKGYKIVGMPMPSSGGILVNQMMKMIEDKKYWRHGFSNSASVQLMAEVNEELLLIVQNIWVTRFLYGAGENVSA